MREKDGGRGVTLKQLQEAQESGRPLTDDERAALAQFKEGMKGFVAGAGGALTYGRPDATPPDPARVEAGLSKEALDEVARVVEEAAYRGVSRGLADHGGPDRR